VTHIGLAVTRQRRNIQLWLLLTAGYFAAGKLGFALAFANPNASPVWPPTGIAIASVLLFGRRVWPAIFIGSFLINYSTTQSAWSSLAIAGGNIVESLVSGYLVERWAGGRAALLRGTGIFLFILLSGLLSTAISATVGVTALSLAGFASWNEYGSVWLTWWLGNAVGAIVVAPVLLCWARDRSLAAWRARPVEISLVLVALLVVGAAAFVGTDYPVGFLTLPVCVWAAFRFGQREATTATCVLSVMATWATVQGYGSFAAMQSPNTALLILQMFMAVITLVGLTVGAGVEERARAEDRERRLKEDLEIRVSERTAAWKAAHSELLASESRFARAQEVAHIGSWEWNIAEQREWWSDELFRICGFEPGSVRPGFDTFLEILDPDDHPGVMRRIDDAVRSQEPFEIEYRIVRPNGQLRWLRAHGRVVTSEGGRGRLLGTVQDVTDRKAAEDFLRRSEQRLKTIIDAEPACVKLVSPDGLLMEMNPAGLEMLGARDISQVVGQSVVHIVHADDRERFLEAHRAASGGSPGRLQFRIVGLDGTQRWVDSHMVPFDTPVNGPAATAHARTDGRAVLSVTSDITAQRHLEDQLRQAQKLDALGRLVGSVAHDFNNFLTALVGYTELALRQIGDDERVYPDLKNDLKEVLNVVHRASALTRQLLIFSRRPTLDAKPVSVDAVLAPIGPMLTHLLGPAVRVRTSLGSGDPLVRIDPNHLEQIVMNLALNARDAMPQGGDVLIDTRVVQVDKAFAVDQAVAPPSGSYVLLTVSDTGTGMDDHVKAHLFEPFFTTKPAGQGTGLGLATVYGIVKQSGGYVWVASHLGLGTTFTIYFPLVPESPAIDADPLIAPVFADDDATVLVVDDDDDVRAVASDVLREHGYRVLEARNGEEAAQVSNAYASTIHAIVSDVILPGMNGPDLVSRLRRSRPDLKALFISGYGHLAIVHHRLLDAEAVLLEKPFTSEQLLNYVRVALTGVAASIRTDR
jgi:PAS domain S-box-containing protein